MKYFKSLFFIIIFSNVLQSAYLNETTNKCWDSYYVRSGFIYYIPSGTTSTIITSTSNTVSHLLDGYDYNATDSTCRISASKTILGMDTKDFNFLLGLMGVIIGGIFMFFTIDAFIKVGGKK